MSDDSKKPWDAIEGETAKAYQAFCCYKDLGPKRTLIAAYTKYAGAEKGGKGINAPGFINAWAKENNWKERAIAFDEARHKAALDATSKQREETIVLAWENIKKGIQKQSDMLDKDDLDPDVCTRIVNCMRGVLRELGLADDTDDTPATITFNVNMVAPPDDDAL